MGKKKSTKKSKAVPKPKDGATLPILQEMFPNIEKDIVSIIFEQNEYDEDKTIQQLEELSLNDGKPAPLLYDELLDGVENVCLDKLIAGNTEVNTTPNKSTKRQTPQFIPTNNEFDTGYNTSNMPYYELSTSRKTPQSNSQNNIHNNTQNNTQNNVQNNSQSNSKNNSRVSPIPFSFQDVPAYTTTSTTYATPKTPSSPTTKPFNISSFDNMEDAGDSKHFLASMFPELDSTMVALLYEENGNDVGKTVESLLSIVFMNHSGGSSEEDEGDESEDLMNGEGEEDVDGLEEYTEEDGDVDYENYKVDTLKFRKSLC